MESINTERKIKPSVPIKEDNVIHSLEELSIEKNTNVDNKSKVENFSNNKADNYSKNNENNTTNNSLDNTTKNRKVRKPKKVYIQPVYTKGEEIFNYVSHIVGGALGILCLIASVIIVSFNPSFIRYFSMIIFSLSIIILYTASSIYHALKQGKAKRVFRVFDHCTIYLLIAGTYTPICLIAFNANALGLTIFCIEWALAIIGITFNAINMNWKAVKILSMVSYVIMGWCIVFSFKSLIQVVPTASIALLVAGGLAYTIGIIFYALKKHKYFHSLWHLFDLAGTILHFISIILFL